MLPTFEKFRDEFDEAQEKREKKAKDEAEFNELRMEILALCKRKASKLERYVFHKLPAVHILTRAQSSRGDIPPRTPAQEGSHFAKAKRSQRVHGRGNAKDKRESR